LQIFGSERRAAIKKEQGNKGKSTLANQANVSKIIGEEWKALSSETKAKYKDLARKEKAAHTKMFPGYKYQPGAPKKKPAKGKGGGSKANSPSLERPSSPVVGGIRRIVDVPAKRAGKGGSGSKGSYKQGPSPLSTDQMDDLLASCSMRVPASNQGPVFHPSVPMPSASPYTTERCSYNSASASVGSGSGCSVPDASLTNSYGGDMCYLNPLADLYSSFSPPPARRVLGSAPPRRHDLLTDFGDLLALLPDKCEPDFPGLAPGEFDGWDCSSYAGLAG
jgi:hypothetical protein